MSPAKHSKKTEILEVRVPPEIKQALKDRAERQDMSISTIVRSLITDYLNEHPLNQPKRPIGITWLSSAIVAIAGIGLFSSALASAGEINVKMAGEIRNLDRDTTRLAQLSTEISLESGEPRTLYFGPSDKRYKIEITARQTEDTNHLVLFQVYDLDQSKTAPISAPSILVPPGERAQIDTSGPDGLVYSWRVETN